MDRNDKIIECGGFYFIHNFDSGNLGHVERVPTELIVPSVNKNSIQETPDYEFNMWTRPDCAGTEFENGNRTWFYFGVQAPDPGMLVRLNLINLNKQGKMYNQGMAPVTRMLPGKPQWERIKDRPVHTTDDNAFTLSFKFRTPENNKATTFFAFTYPYSFAELQIALNSIDLKMLPLPAPMSPDDIYYCRECLIYSLEGRRLDLLTITSHHGITGEREERLKNLFPEKEARPFKFNDKKVIFMSARVHPGETPSSFVFNGFLNLLLSRNDPVAVHMRRLYVFKLLPFLNPDGVARGHYRTDTRGVNLNRVYLNPSLELHPTVYAARALIRYYHYGCEKEDNLDDVKSICDCISECSEYQSDSRKKKAPISSAHKGDRKLGKTQSKGALAERKSARPNSGKESAEDRRHPKSSKPGDRKNSLQEESLLANQVLDLKIQEMPSQTSESSFQPPSAVPSLLNDDTLRCCLGSSVHLTTSEELHMQGVHGNPMRPLRDTLKDSISLLMDSTSSATADSSSPRKPRPPLKVGWCRECRRAVARMEDTMPGVTSLVPGYGARPSSGSGAPCIFNIDEYREHQRQQIEECQRREVEMERLKADGVETFFCTNCFKRYLLAEENEELSVRNTEPDSESAVSCGDNSVCDTSPREQQQHGGSTGDVAPPAKAEPPKPLKSASKKKPPRSGPKEPESGLYLYIDLHGHASKKGIFMYGNHFTDAESSIECMLLPRVMSLNNLHFHFSSCNFTERNMYLKDRRDGMSREGSGRVAVLKATGLVRSYTLECNYNTGRLVNVLPPCVRDGPGAPPLLAAAPTPPKYTPHIFEEARRYQRPKNLEIFEDLCPMEVGRSLGASILDLTGQHPNSRLPASEHRNIASVREWLRHQTKIKPQLTMSRLRSKTSSPSRVPLYVRPNKAKLPDRDERKENAYAQPRAPPAAPAAPAPAPVAAAAAPAQHDLVALDVRITRKPDVRASDDKKSLATKRRNILAIRKPNSKTQVGGVVKAKTSRRSIAEDEPSASSKLSKRSYTRVRRALPTSSSDDMIRGNWEHVPGGTQLQAGGGGRGKRRPAPAPPPAHQPPHNALKKIRLKTAL